MLRSSPGATAGRSLRAVADLRTRLATAVAILARRDGRAQPRVWQSDGGGHPLVAILARRDGRAQLELHHAHIEFALQLRSSPGATAGRSLPLLRIG